MCVGLMGYMRHGWITCNICNLPTRHCTRKGSPSRRIIHFYIDVYRNFIIYVFKRFWSEMARECSKWGYNVPLLADTLRTLLDWFWDKLFCLTSKNIETSRGPTTVFLETLICQVWIFWTDQHNSQTQKGAYLPSEGAASLSWILF